MSVSAARAAARVVVAAAHSRCLALRFARPLGVVAVHSFPTCVDGNSSSTSSFELRIVKERVWTFRVDSPETNMEAITLSESSGSHAVRRALTR